MLLKIYVACGAHLRNPKALRATPMGVTFSFVRHMSLVKETILQKQIVLVRQLLLRGFRMERFFTDTLNNLLTKYT
jgi:hypothetical protein